MSVIGYSVLDGEKIEKAKKMKQRRKGRLSNHTKARSTYNYYDTSGVFRPGKSRIAVRYL